MIETLRRVVHAGVPIALSLVLGAAAAAAVELPPASPAPSAGRAPAVDLALLPLAPAWQRGHAVREVPLRRGPRRAPVAGTALDPRAVVAPSGPAVVNRLSLIEGQGFAGAFPPDTVGAIGRNHFIQVVNSFGAVRGGARVAVYDKGGRRVAGPFLLSELWPNPTDACANALGDGVVVYDALADRFIILELPFFQNFLCVYVARTGDPVRGGFHAYQFQTPSFPDYPKIGVWPGAYVVTANDGDFFAGPGVYALERDRMLAGRLARIQRFSVDALPGIGFQALTPAVLNGSTPPPQGALPIVARHRDTEVNGGIAAAGKDLIELWQVAVNFDRPASSFLQPLPVVAVADFDTDLCGGGSFPCIRQKGTTNRLDAIPEVIMWPLQYRRLPGREVLVGTLTTNVSTGDRAGLYWFELERISGAWTARQSAAFAPGESLNRWMGSIGVDRRGNIAIGYSASSSTSFPSIRVTGRLRDDPAGALRQELVQKRSPTAQIDSNRWGDYAAMTVDPVNDCTFWFTTEYVGRDALWRTQIATYRFPGC